MHSFISSFLQDVLNDDVQHIDAFQRLGMCMWHFRFPFILRKGCIIFYSFFSLSYFQPSLLLFDFHSPIWETFKARFFLMFRGSPSSLTSLSSHLQRLDRSCLYKNYRLSKIIGELHVYRPNHHIHIFARRPPIFIRGYKGQ
jgi:hypothetical protein